MTPEEAAATVRRGALVRLAVGVPALFLVVFGLVLGVRLAGRPVGDSGVWFVLIPVLLVFGAYFAHAVWVLARAGRAPPKEGNEP